MLLLGISQIFLSCENVIENPGDYSVKPTLEIATSVTSIGGTEYPMSVVSERDTAYRYFYTKRDTLKDAAGEPILDEHGAQQITIDTIYYNSKTHAHFVEMALVTLPSAADTFRITLKSNARWKSPVPSTGGKVQWYFNYNILTGGTTTAGGGDGEINFRTLRNRGVKRPVNAVQYIFTSDSTVMYKLTFAQSGERG